VLGEGNATFHAAFERRIGRLSQVFLDLRDEAEPLDGMASSIVACSGNARSASMARCVSVVSKAGSVHGLWKSPRGVPDGGVAPSMTGTAIIIPSSPLV
jgi:hypothetical protein